MRVYTPEECARKADYYYRLLDRTNNAYLAKFYAERADCWDTWARMGGYVAHE